MGLYLLTNSCSVCSPGGYLEYQGYDISAAQSIIPRIQDVLHAFRDAGFPVYHTREGKSRFTPVYEVQV